MQENYGCGKALQCGTKIRNKTELTSFLLRPKELVG
jgi:hypothetical protein